MTKLQERMIKIYANLVKKGEKSIDDVPEDLQKEVLKALANG